MLLFQIDFVLIEEQHLWDCNLKTAFDGLNYIKILKLWIWKLLINTVNKYEEVVTCEICQGLHMF